MVGGRNHLDVIEENKLDIDVRNDQRILVGGGGWHSAEVAFALTVPAAPGLNPGFPQNFPDSMKYSTLLRLIASSHYLEREQSEA